MEKLKLHTPDITTQNIEKLGELFPNCVTEARDGQGRVTKAIDFDQLRQELSGVIVEGPRERYHLDWPGKREAIVSANVPIPKTLRPSRGESVEFESTKNLFIEGDNLDALKLLQETYLGKVKLIYIDPPYNTGRDFIYKDSFAEDQQAYSLRTDEEDASGNRMVVNTELNGRFHSDWLSMIYPRLALAKSLLTDDGAIFVSIADHEVHNLRLVLDQVFGGDNFIATVIWHKMDSPKNTAIHFSEDHDYIVIYARNAGAWRPNGLERTEEMIARYKNPDNDARGPWLLSDLAARNFYAQGRYPITTKKGRVIAEPPAGSYWRVSKEKFETLDRDNRIWWGEDGDNRPGVKRFISEVRKGLCRRHIGIGRTLGSTRNAKQELSGIMSAGSGEDIFITPKPTKLLARILQVATAPEENDLVLDFFAGSATTGHAVFSANAQDAGRRRFILVQFPEPTGTEPYKTIADFAKQRLRRSGEAVRDIHSLTAPDLDTGFRVLKVDTSNMRDIYYAPDALQQGDLLGQVDNIRSDRSTEDLLFQVFVDWGLDLALPIAKDSIDGKEIFLVGDNTLIACFDPNVSDELVKSIAKLKPLRAVFRDASYGSDSVKINVEQIFRLLSPETEVRSI